MWLGLILARIRYGRSLCARATGRSLRRRRPLIRAGRRGCTAIPASDSSASTRQDYLEALCACVTEACAAAGETVSSRIAALSIDTTGSTPCPVDRAGTPLALLPGFEENPNAMFHLWKDHTAGTEAAEITACFSAGTPDYTVYQGPYSSEWYWAKILHTIRQDPAVRAVAYTWVEHCDWMANLLAGRTRPELAYRCACAAGHKAYWAHRLGRSACKGTAGAARSVSGAGP